jgi:hypothetical protein
VIWIGLMIIAMWPGAGSAMTGEEFNRLSPAVQLGFVEGVVRGMYLTCLDHLESRGQVCSFEPLLDAALDLTPDQALADFLSYLKANAAARQKEASEALIDSLRATAKKAK